MATTVASQGTIINEGDATTNWTGAVGTATSDPDPVELTACLTVTVSLATVLTYYTTSVNLSAKTLYMWYTHRAALDSLAYGGVRLYAYDGTNAIAYHVAGKDKAVFRHDDGPSLWQCVAIDTDNPPSTYTTVAGSEANLNWGAITRIGWQTKTLAKAVGGAVNVFYDIMRYCSAGNGLLITGGTSGTPGNFSDVAAADRDDANQKAFGILRELGVGLYGAQGALNFGTASADSWFEEDGFALVFEDRGFTSNKLVFSMTGGEATYENHLVLKNGSIKSAASAVTFDLNQNNVTEIVLESVNIDTKGGSVLFANDSYATAGHSVTSCSFYGCGQIDPGTVAFDSCSIGSTTAGATGAVLLDADGTSAWSNLSFTSGGTGHAIYITATGTYTFTDFTYTGYGADETTDAVVYNNSGGEVTINIVGTDTPTVRNGASASTTLVIAPVTTSVTVYDIETGETVDGARVLVYANTGGDLPFQESVTIARVDTTATVAHTAHGLATNNKVLIAGATQPEYNGVHQITTSGPNAYTYTVTGSPDTPATGTITSTVVIIDGESGDDGDGYIEDTRSYTAPQPIMGRVRMGTGSYYKTFPINNLTISNTAGLDIVAQLIPDE